MAAATDHEKRFLLVALVLSMVAIAVMVGDKLANSDIAHRQTFDLLELIFATIALVCGVVVIVQLRRRPEPDEQVIDLRERLDGLVDFDDTNVDQTMDAGR
jgi:Tfp pilus assembly protein PilN